MLELRRCHSLGSARRLRQCPAPEGLLAHAAAITLHSNLSSRLHHWTVRSAARDCTEAGHLVKSASRYTAYSPVCLHTRHHCLLRIVKRTQGGLYLTVPEIEEIAAMFSPVEAE